VVDHASLLEGWLMFSIVRSAVVGYLIATGLVTTAAMVGRGLIRSARHLAEGRYPEAGTQALAAVVAPAMLAHAATAAVVLDVLSNANALVEDVLEMAPDPSQRAA
jgi:hypothetical protein